MANTISETLEFLTQIHKAWDGGEQRLALRHYPRRSVSYDYYGMTPEQSQYLRALCYAKQKERIEIPLWHAACRLSETAHTDFSHVKIATGDMWLFRGAAGIEFWHDDRRGGERYFLSALYGDGSLKLTEILERDYTAGATQLFPAVYSHLKPESDYVLYADSVASMQLNFDILDDYSLTALPAAFDEFHDEAWEGIHLYRDAIPAAYQGIEIFRLAPSWTGDLKANFSRNANRLDGSAGVVKYDLKSVYSTENKEMEYVLDRRLESRFLP